MKVLFLDIDGVINTVGGELGLRHCLGLDPEEEGLIKQYEAFDPACLYYLRSIVKDTDCKIVISSTWRHGETVESMKSWFSCPVIREAIIDYTPSFDSLSHPELRDRRGRVQRGDEIKYWLDQHPEVTRYAVLDDDSDMDVVQKNFFKTCSWDGLKCDVANEVTLHLNHKELLDHYRMNIAFTKFLIEMKSCFGKVENYKVDYEDVIIEVVKTLDYAYKRKTNE